jgi:hypothetical protein
LNDSANQPNENRAGSSSQAVIILAHSTPGVLLISAQSVDFNGKTNYIPREFMLKPVQ